MNLRDDRRVEWVFSDSLRLHFFRCLCFLATSSIGIMSSLSYGRLVCIKLKSFLFAWLSLFVYNQFSCLCLSFSVNMYLRIVLSFYSWFSVFMVTSRIIIIFFWPVVAGYINVFSGFLCLLQQRQALLLSIPCQQCSYVCRLSSIVIVDDALFTDYCGLIYDYTVFDLTVEYGGVVVYAI